MVKYIVFIVLSLVILCIKVLPNIIDNYIVHTLNKHEVVNKITDSVIQSYKSPYGPGDKSFEKWLDNFQKDRTN